MTIVYTKEEALFMEEVVFHRIQRLGEEQLKHSADIHSASICKT